MLSTRVFLPLMAAIFPVVKAQSELSYRIYNVNADEAIAKLEARTDVVIYDCSMGPSGPICIPRGLRRRLTYKKQKKQKKHKKHKKQKKQGQKKETPPVGKVPAYDMVELTKSLVKDNTHGECFAVASMFAATLVNGPQWVIASFITCEAVAFAASLFASSGDAQSKALEAQANLETKKLAAKLEREKLVYKRKQDEIKQKADLQQAELTAKLAQEKLQYERKQAEIKQKANLKEKELTAELAQEKLQYERKQAEIKQKADLKQAELTAKLAQEKLQYEREQAEIERQDELNKREYERRQDELTRQDELEKLKYEREEAQKKGTYLTQGFMTCVTEYEDMLTDLKLKVTVEKLIRHCQIQEA